MPKGKSCSTKGSAKMDKKNMPKVPKAKKAMIKATKNY
jgi:hypothetical protein